MWIEKDMKPLISVIIPAYNIENYIERCLESVCGQTYDNLEIIVVDDGSTDSTGKIIDEIAMTDCRVVPIHKENGGVSAARNTGLDKACGDYIGFVDGDDIIEKDMYEILLNNALSYGADISHCGYQMVFHDRVDYYYNTGQMRLQDNYQGVYDLIKADIVEPGLWNKLFKKELFLGKYLDEQIKINEDLLLNYYLFKDANKSVFVDLPKYHYMVRENSASTSKMNMNKVKDPLKVIQKMMQLETGEIYCMLEKRYMYLLEKTSTICGLKENHELREYKEKRREELKYLLQENKLKAVYSKKELIQLKLAANVPQIYCMVHEVYSRITGSKNRYKV